MAPKESKGSLGLAENANKRGEAQLRKEQAKLKKRLNVRLTKNELLTPWAIRNCAFTLNHFQPGNDGLTVHKRIHGEDYKGAMLNFGEKCQFKERREQGKLEDRWPFGIWVGKTTLDDEHLLLTPAGVRTARSVKRLPEEKKYDKVFLASCKGTPWNPLATQARETLDAAEIVKPASRKRLYITEALVKKFGKSKGCEACRGQGGPHTEACRSRIEALKAKEDEEKLREANARASAAIDVARRSEQQPMAAGTCS